MNVEEIVLSTPVPRDPEGYLLDPDNWSEDIAVAIAGEERITLQEDYWPILRFMREYHEENRVAPDVRHVVEFLAGETGVGKREAKDKLFRLFPYGYVKQACKIAGMMKPRAWSTG
jgi:tRNA 2-thiouridine synthesizing protein E